MLESFVLCLLSIFAVFGILSMIACFMTKSVKKSPVVISTYNDEEKIETKLRLAMIKNPDVDIIVVDLGSSDDTEKIVKTMSVKYPCIRFIERKIIR